MENAFVDEYPPAANSGIGSVFGCRYKKQTVEPDNETQGYPINIDFSDAVNEQKLFGLVCGFNGGSKTAEFVRDRLIYEILFDNPIAVNMTPNMIKEELAQKFRIVSNRYNDSLNEDLYTRWNEKQSENADSKDKISEIDKKIRAGTTVLLILQLNQNVFVLNCGTGLAIAITSENNAIQLNTIVHENDDEEEVLRFQSINVDPTRVLNPTRAIGDLHRAHLYEENEDFKNAVSAPVISSPDVYYYTVDREWKYLVLISDGVVQNLKDAGVDDILSEVAGLSEENSPRSTAQSLLDKFSRKHCDAFSRVQEERGSGISNRREEMTAVFVKFPQSPQHYNQTADSAISTMSSTGNRDQQMAQFPSIPLYCLLGFVFAMSSLSTFLCIFFNHDINIASEVNQWTFYLSMFLSNNFFAVIAAFIYWTIHERRELRENREEKHERSMVDGLVNRETTAKSNGSYGMLVSYYDNVNIDVSEDEDPANI
ncbi:unnamed protein product [Caenorhabditis bovis]|uniref:PPM-type phosphatase domain-containing protein n=1 Tax=Caenorhabditis bovis TaxID=2654633 RepID=A0A8S1EHC1_9PELO|nr:unnamed protein product [Caenorhabditis bovis]